jgi:hypothetical protein
VFVPAEILSGKEATFRMDHSVGLYVGNLWPYSQILDWAEKRFIMEGKRFYKIDPENFQFGQKISDKN